MVENIRVFIRLKLLGNEAGDPLAHGGIDRLGHGVVDFTEIQLIGFIKAKAAEQTLFNFVGGFCIRGGISLENFVEHRDVDTGFPFFVVQ